MEKEDDGDKGLVSNNCIIMRSQVRDGCRGVW